MYILRQNKIKGSNFEAKNGCVLEANFPLIHLEDDQPRKVTKSTSSVLHFVAKGVKDVQEILLSNTNAVDIELKVYKKGTLIKTFIESSHSNADYKGYYEGEFNLQDKFIFYLDLPQTDVDLELKLTAVHDQKCELGLLYAGRAKCFGTTLAKVEYNTNDASFVQESANNARFYYPRKSIEDTIFNIEASKEEFEALRYELKNSAELMVFIPIKKDIPHNDSDSTTQYLKEAKYFDDSYIRYGVATKPSCHEIMSEKIAFKLEVKEFV